MVADGDTDALRGVPAQQLLFLRQEQASDTPHGGRGQSDLLTHLSEVRWILKHRLGCNDSELLGAALLHSIYGTEGFQGRTVSLERRGEVRALIGERGEACAYLNCVMERASLDAAVRELRARPDETKFVIRSRPEVGDEEIVLTRAQLLELCLVHFADWAQQVAAYSFWSYRRAAYASLAAALGGRCAQVYAETMAGEPDDAPADLPEMVRARQLGIFEQAQSGVVTNEQLWALNARPARGTAHPGDYGFS